MALSLAGHAVAQAMAPTAPQIAAFGMVNHGTPACASCHGFQGQGEQSQNAPRLAGLNADYIGRQLHAFEKGGKTGRDSQRMAWAARSLTGDEIDALADYYASLPPVGAHGEGNGGDVALGRQLAAQGNWAEKVPPCASCHGADGLGVNDEPMSVAVAAARKAGARCGRPDASGVTVCTESSQQRPAGRGMDDVLWTVRLTPAADGTIAHATVARTVAGM